MLCFKKSVNDFPLGFIYAIHASNPSSRLSISQHGKIM
ncbi:hypothetical protein OF001_U220028 [Pseudomonas sp. OF001]|nr:hypothetical protein OF001_U220028 [Pseudomonas sp. OF001]